MAPSSFLSVVKEHRCKDVIQVGELGHVAVGVFPLEPSLWPPRGAFFCAFAVLVVVSHVRQVTYLSF